MTTLSSMDNWYTIRSGTLVLRWDGEELVRLGRKGDSSRRVVDLRKARAYLDRAIAREEENGDE